MSHLVRHKWAVWHKWANRPAAPRGGVADTKAANCDPLVGPDPSFYVDRAFVIGEDRSMVAIVTMPTRAVSDDLPTIVTINTGVIHRVGHHRMFVLLSRALAARGHRVVRFDLSGIGDSGRRNDSLPPLEAGQTDISEMLNWLESSYGSQRFILVGLCSGADQAMVRASSDRRVVGAVLIDPSIPPTRRYYLKYIGVRLVNWRSWTSWLKRMLVSPWKREDLGHRDRSTIEDPPPGLSHPAVREFLEKSYRSVVEADNKILAVFTDGVEFQHNYRKQMIDAFPGIDFSKVLTLAYFERCDHTFTWESQRGKLFNLTINWIYTTKFREMENVDDMEEETVFF